MSVSDYISELPTCPKTGLKLQSYESSYYDHDWSPELPEGWEVFDDRFEGFDPECHKHYESYRVRRIGPAIDVLLASVAQVEGVTFVPAPLVSIDVQQYFLVDGKLALTTWLMS